MKNPVQINLIKKIKQMIPPQYALVDELAELLDISNDSAYRRIRGETALSLDEAFILCNHFKIPFDSINSREAGTVTFNYNPLESSESSFEKYLKSIQSDLKRIESFKEKEIIFAAEDIPLFHHFNYPTLCSFKIFYWNKSILNVPTFEGLKFGTELIDDSMLAIAKDIYKNYCKIPSIEIWTEDTIVSTVKQIEFYWDSGLFSGSDSAIAVCDDLLLMLAQLQRQAESSSKVSAENKSAEFHDNFQLYNSEVMIGNNSILVKMNEARASYLSHHTFNSMLTTNAMFCNETEEWLKNLIKKSILISGVGEKQRYQFFKKLRETVNELKEKIG